MSLPSTSPLPSYSLPHSSSNDPSPSDTADPHSPNSVDKCLVQGVVDIGNEIGCLNKDDLNGSIKCGCQKDHQDLINRGIAYLNQHCPDKVKPETFDLFNRLCAEGISGNSLPDGVHWP